MNDGFRVFVLGLTVFASACAGTETARRSPVRAESTTAPRASGPNSARHGRMNGQVARNARRETEKRQGKWGLSSERVQAVAPIVREAAARYDLPVDLVYGIIWVESRFNPEAVSRVGARGLMQLMPATAKYLAECIRWESRHDAFDEEFNIHAGAYYIARLIREFGDEDLALAAYNAGPTKVKRWLGQGQLPKVSVEYATMVQTARSFFGASVKNTDGRMEPQPVISDGELDRLGLAILISGLSDKEFGLMREDDSAPFDG